MREALGFSEFVEAILWEFDNMRRTSTFLKKNLVLGGGLKMIGSMRMKVSKKDLKETAPVWRGVLGERGSLHRSSWH